jgi:hypothetical protein
MIRPQQRHFISLDPCPSCGGLRYLITRQRKTSIDVIVKCIRKNPVKGRSKNEPYTPTLQRYKTVAKLKLASLNPHARGNSELGLPPSLDRRPRQIFLSGKYVVTMKKLGDTEDS